MRLQTREATSSSTTTTTTATTITIATTTLPHLDGELVGYDEIVLSVHDHDGDGDVGDVAVALEHHVVVLQRLQEQPVEPGHLTVQLAGETGIKMSDGGVG